MNQNSGGKVYQIQAAVLRKKGGPLKIESLEMEGPRDEEVLVRLVGAHPIIGVDRKPKRLELALRLGATHVIDNRRQDVTGRIVPITGRGGDYVVETTASPKMHQLAIDVLNPHGVVALLTGESGVDSLPEGRKTIGIIQGDAIPRQFIPKLIQLYREGQFPFDCLLKVYDFSDINQAIADAKRGYTIKPVLRISTL